ncbi:hypothetical protein PV05_03187 [Exophiala xenobiotica]|uniref:Uncharacterized protein n=1 Tax=Exophiala xenobiotica TaxID=348802 RepID=A0A0D2ESI9_9EURO|nr:uncharacterized protein PV05_03187 [Exophiala xenobiotica]KIW58688.1 hypothetical protein PV05_03187 [Exophiala xenobiotica]
MAHPGSWPTDPCTESDYDDDDDLDEFQLDEPMLSYEDDLACVGLGGPSTPQTNGIPSGVEPSSIYFRRDGNHLFFNGMGRSSLETDMATKPSKPSKPSKKKARTSLKRHPVFPQMMIPVRMQAGNKGAVKKGTVPSNKSELVPVMSVECPIPGGSTTTVTVDPVQNVSWGPITRVEASKEARDLVKQYLAGSEDSGDENDNRMDQESKAQSLKHTPTPVLATEQLGGEDESATTTSSHVGTDSSNLTMRIPRPPPPSPPESIFRAAMSMPTLPVLNRISDVALVEQYRVQRAADPQAFDKENRAIKQGLMDAKVARGGRAKLLKNEYTVELASREDATTAEKWSSANIVKMRSRGNTLTAPSTTEGTLTASAMEALQIRGGESQPNRQATQVSGADNIAQSASCWTGHVEVPDARGIAAEKLKHENVKVKPSKLSPRQLKARLRSLDLASHVAKATSYGSIRHQHSEQREIGDHGEKRTVKTWIEITQVYEVPAPQTLSLTDIVAAVEMESDVKEESNSDGEASVKNDKKTKDMKDMKAKAKAKARRGKATRKNSVTDTVTSDDDSDAENESTPNEGEEEVLQPETQPEYLLRALTHFGEDINPTRLTEMADGLRRIVADLRNSGSLREDEE